MGIVVALNEIQWSVRYAQDDESRGDAEESGRALLDIPPFAKSAKGRAPRVEVGLAKNGRVQSQYRDPSPSASLRVRMKTFKKQE